ncbi:MADS-box transcription factor PHERES 2 [Linum perenne]
MTRLQESIMKKVNELTILCGIQALCIIYKPTVDEPDKPLVWPPSDTTVRELLQRFYSLSEVQRLEKMTNQETYLKKMIAKKKEMQIKLMNKNNSMEISFLMNEVYFGKGLDGMQMHEICNLEWLLKEKINALRRKRDDEYLSSTPYDFCEIVSQTREDRPQGKILSQYGDYRLNRTGTVPHLTVEFGLENQPEEMGVVHVDVDNRDPINIHNVFPNPQHFQPFNSTYEVGQGSRSGGTIAHRDLSTMLVNAREEIFSRGEIFNMPSQAASCHQSIFNMAQDPTRIGDEENNLNQGPHSDSDDEFFARLFEVGIETPTSIFNNSKD